MKIFFVYLFTLLSLSIYSQANESIKGIVIEENSGKTFPGANVLIRSIKKSVITDADGSFTFNRLQVGKYDVEVSAIGFDTKVVTEVEVIKGEVNNITISLVEKKSVLDEVLVTKIRAKAESIKSLLAVQKNSSRVSDGISAESIKRTPDKTTSDVLKRISGASIQDNKFVIIRGLNDRYNASFLNGAPLPSSEPDRKAFSFDIFPANMIDNLVIYKTATPDLPGEFAGGVIDINTKATPDKNFQSLTIGSGYNEITTGKQQIYANGGKTDWIGIDDGTRALPSYIPDVKTYQNLQQNNKPEIINLSKRYEIDWKLNEKTFSPNSNFQYTIGRNFKLKDDSNFGFLVSISHNKTNNYSETVRRSYETEQALKTDQLDKKYSEQVLFGGIANISFKLNANNNFSLKNLFSINSDNKIIDRSGSYDQESDQGQLHTSARLFTSNSIYSGQLTGEHYLSASKIKINWVSSLSVVSRITPNDRSNTYTFQTFADGSPSSTPRAFFTDNDVEVEGGSYLYSSKNKENIYHSKIDLSKKIKISNDFNTEIKTGYFNQSRNRTFEARELGYTKLTGRVPGSTLQYIFDGSIETQPIETIFNVSNIGVLGPQKSGLILFDGTRNNDSYTASSNLNAGYLMFDNAYKKLRLVWGARVESYSQKLNAKSDTGIPITIDDNKIDFLPSANFIYGLNKKQNLRFSFSKTVNRPEFRELAPFLFYDVSTRFNTQGGSSVLDGVVTTLKICNITNFDFRYEIFPGKGQLFSFSAFYKKFENPIELQALANNSNKYTNAQSATNRGIELEYRTLIGSIVGSESKLLNDLTLYTNLAIIRSKVDISNLVSSDNLVDVPLQGQSPYVFNAGLQYINKEMGWSISTNINRVGNRIAIQGNQTPAGSNPAIWEKSRTILDAQIAKSFLNNKLELKFNIQNILKQDQIFYQNNFDLDKSEQITGFEAKINELFTGDSQNKNGYNEKVDDLIWKTKFGRTFSFSMTYNF